MGIIFHPCSSLCGSQQTLDHAGDQCVQCFIDGILYLALFKWYPQREFLGNPVFHRIYDDWLGITALTPWTVLGAALLGSIGLSLIFKKKSGHSPSISFEFDSDSDNEDGKYIGENIKIDNNFGTAIKYVNSDNFCMADVDNSFGSLTVYFDNAIIQSGSAKIKVDNSFGETNLYIPKEWKTENNLGQAFGSVKIHGVCEGSSNNTLKLKGETSFGEINIYYI